MAKIIVIIFILGITELATLLWLGSYAGWLLALGEILVTLLLGLGIIRWVGVFSFTGTPRLPPIDGFLIVAPIDALVLLVAGVLLMLPGLVTDCLGLLLVFLPTRRLLLRMALWYLGRKLFPSVFSQSDEFESPNPEGDIEVSSDEIIDVEFYRIL
ncbi:MAG TPA: FxsA family protein [Thermogutta sp.]|nr:FxsA family protein [Thermogutta sp.]